jgi:hypothetical protein
VKKPSQINRTLADRDGLLAAADALTGISRLLDELNSNEGVQAIVDQFSLRFTFTVSEVFDNQCNIDVGLKIFANPFYSVDALYPATMPNQNLPAPAAATKEPKFKVPPVKEEPSKAAPKEASK